jgi:hypothetical protein
MEPWRMTAGSSTGALRPEPVSDAIKDATAAPAPSPAPGSRGVAAALGSPALAVATDPEIEALDLAPAAKFAAYALKKAHPSVSFTSGRRNKRDQARAMSENVVLNRKWIEQTYAKTIASDSCQRWVDGHPDKQTQQEIEAGLASVIDALPDAEVARLSKHLSGEAFDVQPVTEDAEKIKASIRSLPGLKVFLDMEGGLIRWHAQF